MPPPSKQGYSSLVHRPRWFTQGAPWIPPEIWPEDDEAVAAEPTPEASSAVDTWGRSPQQTADAIVLAGQPRAKQEELRAGPLHPDPQVRAAYRARQDLNALPGLTGRVVSHRPQMRAPRAGRELRPRSAPTRRASSSRAPPDDPDEPEPPALAHTRRLAFSGGFTYASYKWATQWLSDSCRARLFSRLPEPLQRRADAALKLECEALSEVAR